MTFQKVIIIGYGKAANEILLYVKKRQGDYRYQLEFIEHEIHPFSITKKLCKDNGIPFAEIADKKELTAYLLSIHKKTLIISAGNNFLFPKEIVEKENITIINFHNALLPHYPGRNAPSWVIFMGEKETGITWHYVTAGIDEGNIIIQKKCMIAEDIKAYELTKQLMELACDAFVEYFDVIMHEQVRAEPQAIAPNRRMYYSYEVPADGFFEITEEPEYIYRLLRSVDYGKSSIFPRIRTNVNGNEAEILRYQKAVPDKCEVKEGFFYLTLTEDSCLKIKYCYVKD